MLCGRAGLLCPPFAQAAHTHRTAAGLAQCQAWAHLLAVVGLTPYWAPMAFQVMPFVRARRTLAPLPSVKFHRTTKGKRIKASAHAMAQVIGLSCKWLPLRDCSSC